MKDVESLIQESNKAMADGSSEDQDDSEGD